jgi:hypothetical protein
VEQSIESWEMIPGGSQSFRRGESVVIVEILYSFRGGVMAIAYKVVGKKHRCGTNLTLFILSCGGRLTKTFQRMVAEHSEYFPVYSKGAKVTAVPGSVGLLAFRYKRDAVAFQVDEDFTAATEIVRVRAIRGKIRRCTAFSLYPGCGARIADLWEGGVSKGKMCPPAGTVCMKSCEVLD